MLTAPALLLCLAAPLPHEADARPWWHDAVFYEVFVRSFADSREGPLANDGVGDFRGMIDRLDYLSDNDPAAGSDLGIDAVWLMPIAQSPSYHGYDVTDYTRVDDEYGTNADFRALTEACHEHGIRVIVDLVLNHTARGHPWFVESASSRDNPKRDWYVWSENDPGYPGPWGQRVWHATSHDGEGDHYYGCFYRGMPDLNLNNPEVTAELYEVARFWIEEMGVDGFRLDAIKHLIEDGRTQENTQATIDWLEGFNAYCKSLNPDFFTVGEVWSTTDQVARYIPGAVDTAFEFDLAQHILGALNTGDATELAERVALVAEAYDTPVATFLTNHDQPRVMSQLTGDDSTKLAKAKAAAYVLLTLPGVPFIYYGEELGHTGAKPDPNIRTPMQWDATGEAFSNAEPWRAAQPNAATINAAAQRGQPRSLLYHYQHLIALRQQHESLRNGDVTVLRTSDPRVLAYTRRTDEEAVLCVVNTSGDPVEKLGIAFDRPLTSYCHGLRDINKNRSAPSTMFWMVSPEGEHLFIQHLGPYQTDAVILAQPDGRSEFFKDWPRP